MSDAAEARTAMVEGQVRANDVTDRRLVAAMREVARESFAPKAKRALVYGDVEVEVGPGRWLLRPRDFAKLVQALGVEPTDVVLDIASGRGYSTAVLARMAEAVVSLESDETLAERAATTLEKQGVDNAVVVRNDLKVGVPGQGPFDVIFVNGAVETPSSSWFDQLSEGGRLGVVVREGPVGRARVFTKAGGVVGSRDVFDSAAPLLAGFERPSAFTF